MKRVLSSLLTIALAAQAPAQNVPTADMLDERVDLVDFRDAKLGDALRLLSEQAKVNLVASEAAAEKTVSLFLQNLTVRQAVEALALSYGLWYREDEGSGVVRLMTADEFQRDLHVFRDERTAVFTLLFPNAVDVAVAIRNLFGDRVRLSFDREILFDEYTELNERMRRFDLLNRRSQSQRIFGGNQSVYGNGLGSIGGFGNFGYNRNTPLGNFSAFDTPAAQAQTLGTEERTMTAEELRDLEVRMRTDEAEAQEQLLDALPGQPPTIFVSVVRRTNRIAVRTADSSAIGEIERLVRDLDVPTPQVLLEVKVLSINLGDDFRSVFDFAFESGDSSGRFFTGDIPTNTMLTDPGAFVYRFVDDQLQARLQLFERDNRVTELATPMLLVANNEVARLFIGEERPLVRGVSSQTIVNQGTATTAPNTTVEIRPVGTTIMLTPNVNVDRTVTMRVLQEISNILKNDATIPIVLSDGSVFEQPVDVVAERNITGTIVAKDGLTVALGGLIEERVADNREGVPGLMNVPLIGALFRREVKERSRRELVILIRPHVLFTTAEGDAISRDLAKRLMAHPAAAGGEFSGKSLGTFDTNDVPVPPLGRHPLREALRYQSGLPSGIGK